MYNRHELEDIVNNCHDLGELEIALDVVNGLEIIMSEANNEHLHWTIKHKVRMLYFDNTMQR